MSDFLEKPVDLHLVCSKVSELLGRRPSTGTTEKNEPDAEK